MWIGMTCSSLRHLENWQPSFAHRPHYHCCHSLRRKCFLSVTAADRLRDRECADFGLARVVPNYLYLPPLQCTSQQGQGGRCSPSSSEVTGRVAEISASTECLELLLLRRCRLESCPNAVLVGFVKGI